MLEIELQNDGEDPHDLRVRRVGGTHTFSIPLTQPGKRRTVAIHVRPGRYRLWCSVADHARARHASVPARSLRDWAHA